MAQATGEWPTVRRPAGAEGMAMVYLTKPRHRRTKASPLPLRGNLLFELIPVARATG